jgi:oligosaccharide repeat unit polymerase
MQSNELFSFLYIILIGIALFFFRRFFASPVSAYLVSLALMGTPTIFMIDFTHESDAAHLVAWFLAAFSFCAGSFFALASKHPNTLLTTFSKAPVAKETKSEKILIILLLTFSIIITYLYYRATGLNFVSAIASGIEINDYSTSRLSMYTGAATGSNYFAPGYVNQLKNTLLPTFLSITMLWAIRWPILFRVSFLLGCLIIFIWAVAGTGQRIYLVMSAIGFVWSLLLMKQVAHRSSIGRGTNNVRFSPARRPGSVLFVALLLTLCISIVFLRLTSAYQGDGTGQNPLDLAFHRAFFVQQEGGLVGFRYFAPDGVNLGNDWYGSLLQLLPGSVDRPSQAHEVHWFMYGTDRGTVPLSTVGSAFLAFDFFGVAMLFFLFGTGCSMLYCRLLAGPKSVSRCLIYGNAFTVIFFFMAGDPVSLIDNGLLTLLVMAAILRAARKRKWRYSPPSGA